jgi:hypothetical protein
MAFATSQHSEALVEEKDVALVEHWKPRKSFFRHVYILAGHCLASAGLFLLIFLLAWVIRIVVLGLDTVHPYSSFTKNVIDHVEEALICLDVLICGLMTLAFSLKFFRDVLEE